jgi:hypothetical protein
MIDHMANIHQDSETVGSIDSSLSGLSEHYLFQVVILNPYTVSGITLYRQQHGAKDEGW